MKPNQPSFLSLAIGVINNAVYLTLILPLHVHWPKSRECREYSQPGTKIPVHPLSALSADLGVLPPRRREAGCNLTPSQGANFVKPKANQLI